MRSGRSGLEAPPGSGDLQIYYGGPVDERHGFVLHTPDWKSDGTTVVDGRFALTEDAKILESMAGGTGPATGPVLPRVCRDGRRASSTPS